MYLSERPNRSALARASGRRPVGHTVVLLGFVSLLTDVSSESTAAVLPLYLTTVLGLSPLGYGFIDGLYQGATVVVRFLGGWLSDRSDRPKSIAVIGYGLSAVARAALIPVSGLGGVTAVVTADRLGKGLRTAPRDTLIVASADPEFLGRAFGVHRALDTTGAVIGPLLAFAVLWMLPRDYTAVFVVSLAAAVLGLAVLVLLVPNLRPQRAARIGTAKSARPSLRLLGTRSFARLSAAAGLLGLLTISDGFLYLVLVDRDDLAAEWFPLLFVGTNVAYLGLAVPFGRLADRFGRARVLVCGHGLLLVAYLCVASPTYGIWAILACLLALGGYYAATDGVLSAATSALVPTGLQGSAIATTQSVVAVSRLVASIGFGWLWLEVGRQTAVYVVAGALAIALPVAMLLVRALPAPVARA